MIYREVFPHIWRAFQVHANRLCSSEDATVCRFALTVICKLVAVPSSKDPVDSDAISCPAFLVSLCAGSETNLLYVLRLRFSVFRQKRSDYPQCFNFYLQLRYLKLFLSQHFVNVLHLQHP